MARRSERRGGFTFLELVVVVSILAIITAAIVPVYSLSVAAMKQRGARGDLVATIYYLQELSIRQTRELRLYIGADEGRYWAAGWVSGMGEDQAFEALSDRELGEGLSLPTGMVITRVESRRERGGPHFIAFYPSGASDTATIHIQAKGDASTAFQIEITGALGDVVVKS